MMSSSGLWCYRCSTQQLHDWPIMDNESSGPSSTRNLSRSWGNARFSRSPFY